MSNENTVPVNRTFKSTVFIMLFEDKENLLELYNAMTEKHYTDQLFSALTFSVRLRPEAGQIFSNTYSDEGTGVPCCVPESGKNLRSRRVV